MENFLKLKNGNIYELTSYSYGEFGALILCLPNITIADAVSEFTRENTEEIFISIGGRDTFTVSGYQHLAFLSVITNGVKIALEKEHL